MFLQDKQTGTLVEVVDTLKLIDPMSDKISGKVQEGQEEQPPEEIAKSSLVFPSGEDLPRCWLDADYRTHQ
ncbi:MAG TPA: acetyltransferase [Trichocoleus sp.]|jgi:hypothetical protein